MERDGNVLGYIVMLFVQNRFPGGAVAFTEQGGAICLIPFKKDSVLLYHPEMPESFVKEIDIFNAESGIDISIAEDLNFKDTSMEEVMPVLSSVAKDIIAKYDLPGILFNPVNPLVLFISIPSVILTEEIVRDIIDAFSTRVPSIVRAVLMVGDLFFPFSSSEAYAVPSLAQNVPLELLQENGRERQAITNDIITDLKIDLECMDVNDFINKM